MSLPIFRRNENWSKQKDIAIMTIDRLKSVYQVEHPCEDYASALAMAQMIVHFDKYRIVSRVEVYASFVRLLRNEKGSFAFPAVVIDKHGMRYNVSEG